MSVTTITSIKVMLLIAPSISASNPNPPRFFVSIRERTMSAAGRSLSGISHKAEKNGV